MEPDSGDGLIDGLRIISNYTPPGISCLVELMLDSQSASLLFALGT
jgi:hypothetical protein